MRFSLQLHLHLCSRTVHSWQPTIISVCYLSLFMTLNSNILKRRIQKAFVSKVPRSCCGKLVPEKLALSFRGRKPVTLDNLSHRIVKSGYQKHVELWGPDIRDDPVSKPAGPCTSSACQGPRRIRRQSIPNRRLAEKAEKLNLLDLMSLVSHPVLSRKWPAPNDAKD